MIVLQKGEDTSVVVTFSEKTTIDPVFYLLELTSSTNVVTYIQLTPVTLSERYDRFTINSDLHIGEYLYTAYQSSVEDPTIDDVEGIVEHGVLIIEGEESNEIYA